MDLGPLSKDRQVEPKSHNFPLGLTQPSRPPEFPPWGSSARVPCVFNEIARGGQCRGRLGTLPMSALWRGRGLTC